MKKIITMVLFAVALFAPKTASAQIKIGLKGGLNVTKMSFNSDVLDESNRPGFFIGPTIKFNLPIVGLGVDASALYNQRESKVKIENKDQTLKTKAFSVPINLRYGLGLGSTAEVFLFAGPQFDFNVGDKNQSIYDDAADWRLKSSTMSMNVGLGITLLTHLQVSANYNFGMGKTGDITVTKAMSETYKDLTKDGHSHTFQLALAYYF